MGRLGARRGDPHHCRGSPLKEHIRSRFGNRMQRCLSEASAWVDIIQCRLASVRRNRSDQAVSSGRMYRQAREDILGRPTLGRAAHNSTQMLASFVMDMRVWRSRICVRRRDNVARLRAKASHVHAHVHVPHLSRLLFSCEFSAL